MATPKKVDEKLLKLIPQSRGGLNRPGKMMKMIQARCRICNEGGNGYRGWWDDCQHDPYWHFELKRGVNLMEQREDGTWFQRTATEQEYDRVPNWKQIAHDIKITSGRMVQIQIERGSKFPEDLGFPPLCDYYNCWVPNPEVLVTYAPPHEESDAYVPVGKYHARDEAAIMQLRFEGVPIFIGSDSDISKGNSRIRQLQLQKVNLGGNA